MGRPRYQITRELDEDFSGTEVYHIKDLTMEREFGYAKTGAVWRHTHDGSLWCASCSSRLNAMSRSCCHVQAVRRYIRKEEERT